MHAARAWGARGISAPRGRAATLPAAFDESIGASATICGDWRRRNSPDRAGH
jgi:hypothetical protein